LRELVPPFAIPTPPNIAVFDFLEEIRSIEMEYIEKRIVVEDVDRCTGWFADPEPGLLASRYI